MLRQLVANVRHVAPASLLPPLPSMASASPPRETDPLLPRRDVPASEFGGTRKAGFVWLVPVLVGASLCQGISMAAHYKHHQQTFCPGAPYPCGSFAPFFQLPGLTVHIEHSKVFASFMVSFATVGWWSELGDRRGRRMILFFPILGTAVLDLMFHIVGNIYVRPGNARDVLSIGYIIQGLLGGLPMYLGAIHAYAFDVAESPLQRITLFALIDAISFGTFIVGAVIGHFANLRVAYIISFGLGLLNLAFIYKFLPESLPAQAANDTPPPARTRPLVKSVFTPISVFFRAREARYPLVVLAVGYYLWSLATATDTAVIRFSLWRPANSPAPPLWLQWFGYVSPRLLSFTTLLIIIPALVHLYTTQSQTRGESESESAALKLSSLIAQNALLFGALAALAILLFASNSKGHILYAFFAAIIPLCTPAVGPALYALAGSYQVRVGRNGEVAQVFSALALWGLFGMAYSYTWYGYGLENFGLTAMWYILALMCLQPKAPEVEPVQEQERGGAGMM
ncbi:hypothetical protein C8F01DRAFT_1231634 [Mycena amicta]|nr:hypothetical protein C8F01DRAFT_1231634 [Mycena amicta]